MYVQNEVLLRLQYLLSFIFSYSKLIIVNSYMRRIQMEGLKKKKIIENLFGFIVESIAKDDYDV